MYEEKRDYNFSTFKDFEDAYAYFIRKGYSLYSPGYLCNKYGISRQLIHNWAYRDNRIRQISLRIPNAKDVYIFVIEEDVVDYLESSRLRKKKN